MPEENAPAHRRMPEHAVVARFVAETYREAEGGSTVEVVVSTGAPWPRYDWASGQRFMETLDISKAAVRLARLNDGGPVLLDHRNAVENQVGVVQRAWIDGKELRAELRFASDEKARGIAQKVRDGILRNVSCTYLTHKVRVVEATAGQMPEWRAVDWEPLEVSFVAVPVDSAAGVRSADAGKRETECEFIDTRAGDAARNPEKLNMSETKDPGAQGAPEKTAVAEAEITARAIETERTRVAEIETIFTGTRSLVGDEADAIRTAAIKDGHTPDQVRAALLDAVIKRGASLKETPKETQRASVGDSNDAPEAIREAMADAIAVQIRGTYKPKTERYREYAGARPSDMVRTMMQVRGVRDIPFNRVALAERSFHATSDFPLLLLSALNKVLLSDYELAAPTYRTFMARKVFNDFKAHSFLRVGDFPALSALAEGGQITLGTMSENREQVTLATYAKGIRVTRQMLVNDNLGAFSDFSNMIGRRVVDFESATAFAVLTSGSGAGPNLSDGNAVFTTGRGNRAGSGGAIDVTTLSTARQALRGRTSPDGLKLNLSPRYLLTGPAYETIAWQYTSAQYVPATAGTTNPFLGTYTPVVDANIAGNNWYLFADPAVAPVYVYGFLAGSEGPQTRTYNPEASDGAVAIDVWLDFAAGAIDWRGGQFNPGA